MTNQKPFITSVRVQPSAGGHEYVSIWIRGQNVGTLCVGKGEGEQLARLLQGCQCSAEFLDRHGVHMFGCRMVSLGDRVAFEGAPPDEPVDERTSVQSHPRRPRLWPPLSRDEYLEKLREFERRPHRARFTVGAGVNVQPECTICGRPCCECTTPSTCGRCHGCTRFDDRPFHVAPEDPPTLMDAREDLTPWMRGALDAMRVPDGEGDHTKAGEEPGAPAPPPDEAIEASGESGRTGVPSAAGAPELA